MHLAEPEGYIRSFVDEGTPIETLLSFLRTQEQKQGPTPYLDTVLASFPSPAIPREQSQPDLPPGTTGQYLTHAQPSPLLDPLSGREQEVLRWMAQGASNQEIADALVVTAATIKYHVSNILSKDSFKPVTLLCFPSERSR